MADKKKYRTPPGILNFVNLMTPGVQEDDDGNSKEQYSTVIVWPAGTDLTELKTACVNAAKEAFGKNAVEMIRKRQVKFPIKDAGDKDQYGEPFVAGATYATLRTYNDATGNPRKPGVVSRIPDPKNDMKPTPITDPEEVYSGILAWATVSVFAGTHPKGGKYVSISLHNVQKLADGDRLDGRAKAEDDFDADMDLLASLPKTEDDANADETPEEKPKRGRGRKAKKPEPEPEPEPDNDEEDEDDLSDILG